MRRPSASVFPISTVMPRGCAAHQGTEGVPRNAVLNRRDQDAQPHRQACHHDHTRQAECGRGTAHILLHQLHTGRRLQVEAAAVKTDSLYRRSSLSDRSACPTEYRSAGARGRTRGPPHAPSGVLLEQVVADDDAELRLELPGQVYAPRRPTPPAPCQRTAC